MASSKLLLAAKSLSVDPGAANAKNLLAVAARYDIIQREAESFLLPTHDAEYLTGPDCVGWD